MPGGMETSAIARLTEREKDCLRRWLRHETAKEIALDLGISPHAVEKRLKMARAKLGVSSSLEAARLLETAEGYQLAGPEPPDLSPHPLPRKPWQTRYRIIGGIALSATIVLTGTLLFSLQSAAPEGRRAVVLPRPDGTTTIVQVMSPEPLVVLPPEETLAALIRGFAMMDLDRSSYIEVGETPSAAVVSFTLTAASLARDDRPVRPAPADADAARSRWMSEADANDDGRLDEAEFIARHQPLAATHGVPESWASTS
ncbi:MAG: hypothetical protein B7Z08_09115 [Sphingomonadales bacterium 32-68-7]|nr:MAG: hypothetical protein B7Z08_09115 [Sphingomonadales bacterium 32-68-7]